MSSLHGTDWIFGYSLAPVFISLHHPVFFFFFFSSSSSSSLSLKCRTLCIVTPFEIKPQGQCTKHALVTSLQFYPSIVYDIDPATRTHLWLSAIAMQYVYQVRMPILPVMSCGFSSSMVFLMQVEMSGSLMWQMWKYSLAETCSHELTSNTHSRLVHVIK